MFKAKITCHFGGRKQRKRENLDRLGNQLAAYWPEKRAKKNFKK